MKYMHFRASCSYAALAEILEAKGIDTEDSKIALDMKLPWLFAKEEDSFLAGPMLQGGKWFDLWLRPRGLQLQERALDRESLCSFLQKHCSVMLGLLTPHGKHAVVQREYDGKYRFWNPTHEGSGEETEMSLDQAELLERTDPITVVGELVPANPETPDLRPLQVSSVSVLRENVAAIEDFAVRTHAPEEYLPAMNRLFRALLLDGITMLELAGETDLAQKFTALQQQFMAFMRGTREEALRETLSTDSLHDLTEQYASLIEQQIERLEEET